MMAVAASITALSPLEHTLLTSVQGVEGGRPAPREACVAGAWGQGVRGEGRRGKRVGVQDWDDDRLENAAA